MPVSATSARAQDGSAFNNLAAMFKGLRRGFTVGGTFGFCSVLLLLLALP